MQLVKPVSNQGWWILNQMFPGRADFLMQQTSSDRMEAVATYLAQQIKVETRGRHESKFGRYPKCFFWLVPSTHRYPKIFFLLVPGTREPILVKNITRIIMSKHGVKFEHAISDFRRKTFILMLEAFSVMGSDASYLKFP